MDWTEDGRLDVTIIFKSLASYHNSLTLFLILHFFLLMVIGNIISHCLFFLVDIVHDDYHGDCD